MGLRHARQKRFPSQSVTPLAEDVVVHDDSSPKRGNSLVTNADAVEAVRDSKKTSHIAGHRVCAANIIGFLLSNGVPYGKPDIAHNLVYDQEVR